MLVLIWDCIFDYPQFTKMTFNPICMIMESTLNYRFKRRSNNYFEWLLYTVKSEKYHEAESQIVSYESTGLRLQLTY